jgi:hypothetical protein
MSRLPLLPQTTILDPPKLLWTKPKEGSCAPREHPDLINLSKGGKTGGK